MKRKHRSPMISAVMFLAAVVLLFAGTVGGTQAALQVRSSNYYSAFDLDHIGVSLYENGTKVAYRDYGQTAASKFDEQQNGMLTLKKLSGTDAEGNPISDQQFRLGKKYPFVITARNSGTIDQYLRVTVYKYWTALGKNEKVETNGWFHGLDSTKLTDKMYDPSLIELSFGDEAYNTSAWIRDEGSSTAEREVYYYRSQLAPSTEESPIYTEALFDHLKISTAAAQKAAVSKTETEGKTVTTYTYAYDGLGFVVEVSVDAIQTHHARKAMTSVWGTDSAVMDRLNLPQESA